MISQKLSFGFSITTAFLMIFIIHEGNGQAGAAPKVVEGQACYTHDDCDTIVTRLFCIDRKCQCNRGVTLEQMPLDTTWYLPWGRCVSKKGSICDRIDNGYGYVCELGFDCYPVPNTKLIGVCGSCVVQGSAALLVTSIMYALFA